MAKTLNNKPEIADLPVGIPHMGPLIPIPVMKYLLLQEELKKVKQRLLELENREKIIVLRELTREEAKEEIRQLFKSGRTLYYSDVAEELKLDLKLVVDICRELQESNEIGIDEDALARIS